ncbi:MAG: antibiotic biosynthesis monooxygenase family protein [Rubrivivax sp.]
MIHVIATLDLASGTRAEVLAAFAQVVPLVLAETGCLAYEPTIDAETDLAMQSKLGPDRLTIVERWSSLEALHAHAAAPHMQTHRDRVKGCVQGREIRVLVAA